MAKLLWGKVYFHNHFAGIIREEPNDTISFTYDNAYIAKKHPKIAHTLPIQNEPHISFYGLHPFFDNLVSEGWLEQAQTRLLGKRTVSRFELLLAFGFDCAGAVSIIDPEPSQLTDAMLDLSDPKEMGALTGRASLSGVQPKLALIKKDGIFTPAHINQLSTHIAKFPSDGHLDIVLNEYLTMTAFNALLPDDKIANISLDVIEGFEDQALIIERFDRNNNKRIHFEEFNQLLNKPSKTKYDGAYKNMADFIQDAQGCLPMQNYILFKRILVGILLGNTDMHFKNFAMMHESTGYRLAPSYDQVCAVLYNYKTIALETGGVANLQIGSLKARHIVLLGQEFGLSKAAINMAVSDIEKVLDNAKQSILDTELDAPELKDQIISFMDKRWNGIFTLIGKALSMKP